MNDGFAKNKKFGASQLSFAQETQSQITSVKNKEIFNKNRSQAISLSKDHIKKK